MKFIVVRNEVHVNYELINKGDMNKSLNKWKNDTAGKNHNPTATYVGSFNQEDKDSDKFLYTYSITAEKYVESAYNLDLFQFANFDERRLLNDIQTEEQNHAEKIYKYRTVKQRV